MKKIKIVLDTNIFISGYLFGGNPLRCLELAREGKIRVFASNAILLELAEKLYTKFDWKEDDIKKLLDNINRYVEVIEPKHNLALIKRDEPDNRVLEIAQEIDADFIVSGDKKHILPIKKFGKTNIVTAADFIKMVDIEN